MAMGVWPEMGLHGREITEMNWGTSFGDACSVWAGTHREHG